MGNNKWITVVIVLLVLGILSYIVSGLLSLSNNELGDGNVALIKINGVIMSGDGSLGKKAVSSEFIVNFIKDADKNSRIKAIVFDINSPGGSAVASKEIGDAIKRVNKTTMALIREIGTSGAYWIASATDHIVANELSITGSIGVTASYLEFSDLMNEYGINYKRLVSGEYKDIGTPLRNLTVDEETILKKQLDKIHKYFVQEVSENRDLKLENVEKIANGVFYLGDEALRLGLIDELGDMETLQNLLKNVLQAEVTLVEYKKPVGLFESFFNSISEQSFSIGRGIGSGLVGGDSIVRI